ncbi:hypothetical protein OC835_007355 [Tilletia horrida]|nr:hypothetical protein OC835_007355 [Tilletia horrida]KAK0556708.1 hypothetical protein OC844_005776 [Tilletia horrida]
MSSVPAAFATLRRWLDAHDVRLHPALFFAHDDVCGMSIFTCMELPAGTCAIDLPASLPITSTFSRASIASLVGVAIEGNQAEEEGLHARLAALAPGSSLVPSDWVVFHLALVRLLLNLRLVQVGADGKAAIRDPLSPSADRTSLADLTRHAAYIQAIPYPEVAPTPLHFNAAELNLLRGTSLHGATLERRRRGELVAGCLLNWLVEHKDTIQHDAVRQAVESVSGDQAGSRRWSVLWRWADTAFGSDDGPASIGAVLIPGLDSFNHQRGRPVTWKHDASTDTPGTAGRTKLILDSPTDANAQVFNNYGAKSTEELLGSYGFVLDDPEARQDDALGLVVSARPAQGVSEPAASSGAQSLQRHWWRYGNTQGPPRALIDEIRARLREGDGDGEDGPALDELEQVEQYGEVYEALLDMLQAKLQSFRAGPSLEPIRLDEDGSLPVREGVARMVNVYRGGQETILTHAIAWCDRKLEELEARWAELGGDE